MKQVLAIVLHSVDGTFDVSVRQRDTGYYGKWLCESCRASGTSQHDFADKNAAFDSVKEATALHKCNESRPATK